MLIKWIKTSEQYPEIGKEVLGYWPDYWINIPNPPR